jgi:hypothetical protein
VPQVVPKVELVQSLADVHEATQVPPALHDIPLGHWTVPSHPSGTHWPVVGLQVPLTELQSESIVHDGDAGTQTPPVEQALPFGQAPSAVHWVWVTQVPFGVPGVISQAWCGLGHGLVSEQSVWLGAQVPRPVTALHENPVGHITVGGSQVSGLHMPLWQVADSSPVLANVQSESAVHPGVVEVPGTQKPPSQVLFPWQSLSALHRVVGEQNPLMHGRLPGQSTDVWQLGWLGIQV